MSHGLERLNAVQASLSELANAVAALVREDDRDTAEQHLLLAESELTRAGQLEQAEEH